MFPYLLILICNKYRILYSQYAANIYINYY